MSNFQKATTSVLGYDKYGNVTFYYDVGDLNSAEIDITTDDNYQTTIDYHEVPDKHIVGIPSSMTVIGVGGLTYRQRETSIDSLYGDITQIRQYLADGSSANIDMIYDAYGNLDSITRAPNHLGERLGFGYTYDPEVHTLMYTLTLRV